MELKNNILTYTSLNTPVGDDEIELGDFIPGEESLSVEEVVAKRELHRILDNIIATLTEREQEIINMRFGLKDGKPRTLEYIGNKLGVTRERIRQIESKALKKLRHPSRSGKLRGFLE